MHADDISPNGCFYLYSLRKTSKMKKNRILSSPIFQSQSKSWKKFITCLPLLLTLWNPSFQIIAKESFSNSMISNFSDETDTPQLTDRLNAASFLAASNSFTYSQKSVSTIIERVEKAIGFVSGIAVFCFLSYKSYEISQNTRLRERNLDRFGERTSPNDSSSNEVRGTILTAVEGKQDINELENISDDMETKFIDEMTPCVTEEVYNFLQNAFLSKTDRLNVFLYASCCNINFEGKYENFSQDEQKSLLEKARSFREEKFSKNNQKIGVYIAELQALSEIRSSFPFSEEELQDLNSSTSSNESENSNPSKKDKIELLSAYQAYIDTNIIDNSDLELSQRLDLLALLKNPLTCSKDRLEITSFLTGLHGQSQQVLMDRQKELLEKSKKARITIHTLLKELPQQDQNNALIRIIINRNITYNDKLDLLTMAIKQTEVRSSILKLENLNNFINQSKGAFDLFYNHFLDNAVDQNIITKSSYLTIKNKFFQPSNLSYKLRLDLLHYYYRSKDSDERASIIGFVSNNTNKTINKTQENNLRMCLTPIGDIGDIIESTEFYEVELTHKSEADAAKEKFLNTSAQAAAIWRLSIWDRIQNECKILQKPTNNRRKSRSQVSAVGGDHSRVSAVEWPFVESQTVFSPAKECTPEISSKLDCDPLTQQSSLWNTFMNISLLKEAFKILSSKH